MWIWFACFLSFSRDKGVGGRAGLWSPCCSCGTVSENAVLNSLVEISSRAVHWNLYREGHGRADRGGPSGSQSGWGERSARSSVQSLPKLPSLLATCHLVHLDSSRQVLHSCKLEDIEVLFLTIKGISLFLNTDVLSRGLSVDRMPSKEMHIFKAFLNVHFNPVCQGGMWFLGSLPSLKLI